MALTTKRFVFLVCFLLFSTGAKAQDQIPPAQQGFTFGMANGRAWKAMQTERVKVYYLTGIRDILIATNPPRAKDYQIDNVSTGELAASIDAFYAIPENVRIPIVNALSVSILKFKGWSPAELESLTADFRKVTSAQ